MKGLNSFEYVQNYLPLYTTNVKYKVSGWVVYNKRIILNNKLKKDLTNHFVVSGLKTDSVFTTEEKEINKVNFITKKLNNYASPWKFNRLYNFYYSNLSFFKKLKLWERYNNKSLKELIAWFFVNKNLVLFIDYSKFILNKLSVLQIKNKFRYYQVNIIDQFKFTFLKNNKKVNVKNHINFAKHLRYLKKYNVGSPLKKWETWRKVNLWRKSILKYNLKPTSYNKFKAPKYLPYFIRRIKRLYLKKIYKKRQFKLNRKITTFYKKKGMTKYFSNSSKLFINWLKLSYTVKNKKRSQIKNYFYFLLLKFTFIKKFTMGTRYLDHKSFLDSFFRLKKKKFNKQYIAKILKTNHLKVKDWSESKVFVLLKLIKNLETLILLSYVSKKKKKQHYRKYLWYKKKYIKSVSHINNQCLYNELREIKKINKGLYLEFKYYIDWNLNLKKFNLKLLNKLNERIRNNNEEILQSKKFYQKFRLETRVLLKWVQKYLKCLEVKKIVKKELFKDLLRKYFIKKKRNKKKKKWYKKPQSKPLLATYWNLIYWNLRKDYRRYLLKKSVYLWDLKYWKYKNVFYKLSQQKTLSYLRSQYLKKLNNSKIKKKIKKKLSDKAFVALRKRIKTKKVRLIHKRLRKSIKKNNVSLMLKWILTSLKTEEVILIYKYWIYMLFLKCENNIMNLKLSKLKKLNFITSKEKKIMNLYLLNIKKNKRFIQGLESFLKRKIKKKN